MMKKTLILFAFLCFSFAGWSQSLTFSQGVNLAGHCGSGTHVIDTVPAGKLWKVENMAHAAMHIRIKIPGAPSLNLTQDDYGYPMIAPGSATNNSMTHALWLTAGQVLEAYCFNGSSTSYRYFISILEFDVGP